MSYIARLACGSDKGCYEDLEEVLELYRELHRAIEGADVRVEFDPTGYPLIERIRDRDRAELARKAIEIMRSVGLETSGSAQDYREGEGDQGAVASYIYRRLLYRASREKVSGLRWEEGRCPVCGLTPIAGISKKVSQGFYARTVLELRCLCGFSWDYDLFRCPSCGNRDRAGFEVIVVGGVSINRCKQCGHIVGVIPEAPGLERDLAHIAVSHLVMRLSGGGEEAISHPQS